MTGCELYKVFKRINPDFACNENCGSNVVCSADVEKYVPERRVPESREVGVSASYEAKTIPQKLQSTS